MLGRPDLLVLDEPTVGPDPELRADLWHIFRALASDGAALLVSSHVMDEALRCDRLLLLRAGRLIADTTPRGVLSSTGTRDPDAAFLARSGTLERLMTTPLGKGDFIVGYALAFAVLTVLQALVTVTFAVVVCGLQVEGPLWRLGLVVVAFAVGALALAALTLRRRTG